MSSAMLGANCLLSNSFNFAYFLQNGCLPSFSCVCGGGCMVSMLKYDHPMITFSRQLQCLYSVHILSIICDDGIQALGPGTPPARVISATCWLRKDLPRHSKKQLLWCCFRGTSTGCLPVYIREVEIPRQQYSIMHVSTLYIQQLTFCATGRWLDKNITVHM